MQEVTKKRNDAVGRKKQSLGIALTRDLFWPTVDEHHRFPFGNPAALPPPKGCRPVVLRPDVSGGLPFRGDRIGFPMTHCVSATPVSDATLIQPTQSLV
jgi:hypothetical protein